MREAETGVTAWDCPRCGMSAITTPKCPRCGADELTAFTAKIGGASQPNQLDTALGCVNRMAAAALIPGIMIWAVMLVTTNPFAQSELLKSGVPQFVGIIAVIAVGVLLVIRVVRRRIRANRLERQR